MELHNIKIIRKFVAYVKNGLSGQAFETYIAYKLLLSI
jgi:hypothetical protein